jgi:uncharacterized Zn finger protein (UPF0148 family)
VATLLDKGAVRRPCELEEADVADEKCPECGEPVVEGRLNCPKCGSAYANLESKELERDPEEQGDLPTE